MPGPRGQLHHVRLPRRPRGLAGSLRPEVHVGDVGDGRGVLRREDAGVRGVGEQLAVLEHEPNLAVSEAPEAGSLQIAGISSG